jgi:hypothetical protein
MEFNGFDVTRPRDSQMIKIRARSGLQPPQPFLRSKIKIGRPDQFSDFAAIMRFFDLCPRRFEFSL